MSLLFPYSGRFLERVLPGPIRTAEKGSDNRQHDSDHKADGENRVRDEPLARKPAANTLTIVIHVGQQHQSRYQQPRHHQRQFMKALKSRRFGQDQANALTVVIFR